MPKTIYLNLEDDVPKVVDKLRREKSSEVVLVFPKQSFLFSDSINLRLLKKQVDLLGKKVSILTMDEKGRMFAEEAGFELKVMPRAIRPSSLSDIRPRTAPVPATIAAPVEPEIPQLEKTRLPAKAEDPSPPLLMRRKTRLASARSVPERSTRVTGINRLSRPTFPSAAPAGIPPVATKDNVYIPPTAGAMKPPAKRRSYTAYATGFVALTLIVILLLVLVVLPSATVKVFARTDNIARDLDVQADTKATAPQISTLTVPAVLVNESKSSADTFQVNGKKEVGSKAEGRVAIYNLTGQPMALRAATTTLTIGDKSYVFKQDQGNVRPVADANDTNATVADIVATGGGEGFNVPAGTRVEITNQAFGSQPQRLYARTITQVIGGSSRFVSVVSREDLDNAQKELVRRTVEGINASLSGVKLVEGAYTVNVQSFTSDQGEGAEVQNFTAQLQVNIVGFAFNETDLKNMVRQRLLTTLGGGKALQELEKDAVIYKIKNLDANNGLMQLSIHYESKSKPQVDADKLKNEIAGKSKVEASNHILTNPDIDRVEITLQPAWQRGLPSFKGKIKLEIVE